MYQSVFNYKKEFQLYNKLLKKYKCKKILELGCGSGNLASFFLKAGYNYTGLDLFKEMIKIAKKAEPKAKFVQGDMRNISLKGRFDAILITGRSFTYLTTNDDIMNALESIHKTLKKNGTLIFDNFNAEAIFKDFKKPIVQYASFKGTRYKRITKKKINLKTGWAWDLDETYYINKNGKTKIIKDTDTLRAFTLDELKLFLKLNNFEVLRNSKQDFAILTFAKKK
jgi:SAM-dependent methyltransferase